MNHMRASSRSNDHVQHFLRETATLKSLRDPRENPEEQNGILPLTVSILKGISSKILIISVLKELCFRVFPPGHRRERML